MPWPDSLHSPAEDLADLLYYEATGADPSSSPLVPPTTFHPHAPRLPSPHPPGDARAGLPPFSPPPPLSYQDTLRDVEHALHNADMALRNAQAAFRQGRMAQSRSNDVIDLTTSSEDASDGRFMAQTRHPHDSDRSSPPPHPLGEPIYGSLLPVPLNQTSTNLPNHSRMPSLRDLIEHSEVATRPPMAIPPMRPGHPMQAQVQANARAEASAVRRQRQARRDWERVERRNRLRAEQAAQADPQEGPRPNQATSQHSSPATTTFRPRRRASDVSNASLHSNHSITYSLGSDSVDSIFDDTQSTDHATRQPAAAIDLTAVEDATTLDTILAKEQQDAIAAQTNSSPSSTQDQSILQRYKCAICMDSPTDATSTTCGHLFCHRCIIDSLKWSERQRHEAHPRTRLGLCPVCRKPLQQKDVTSGRGQGAGLVSLEIKTMSRKDYNAKREREKNNVEREEFLNTVVAKGKQRAETEEKDVLKTEGEDPDVKPLGLAAARRRRKRKRSGDARMKRESADVDSLFGSPIA